MFCNALHAQPPNNPIFSGGNADGIDKVSFAQAFTNIYSGGNADGVSFNSFAQAQNNIYAGGNADGWSLSNFAQASNNIFAGGNADGWSFNNFVQAENNIFLGGNADGWSFNNFAQAENNIFFGGIGDGWASTYRPLGPLPVSLLSFTATKANAVSILNWEIETAINFAKFGIERGADAVSFVTIGTTPGTSATQYAFTDNFPLKGNNYYRLKLKDTDGSFKYTAVRVINFDEAQQTIKVFPNPATSYINLTLSAEMLKENLVINVVNVAGQVVLHQRIPANGSAIIRLGLTLLPASTYYIHVKGIKTNTTTTIVKL